MNSLSPSGYRINGNLNEGVGDKAPGSPQSGTITGAPYEGAVGQLGANVFLSTLDLAGYTNPTKTNTTLYGGWYKYVHFKSAWSATLAIGQPLFYVDIAGMLANEVTADATAASIFAGFALNATTTKNNYWWIQVSGITWALCKAAVTDTTAGDLAVQTDGTTATIDAIADGTDYYTTALKGKLVRGIWLDAPSSGLLKRMVMIPAPIFQ